MLNSWRGKFHLEMHYWHAANLPLWGHPELLERSLAWYSSIQDVARATATRQGYEGHVGQNKLIQVEPKLHRLLALFSFGNNLIRFS